MAEMLGTSGVVTTRKPHLCIGCYREWPKKSQMFTWTVLDLGKATRYYMCLVCDKYWVELVNSYNGDCDDLEVPLDGFPAHDFDGYAATEQDFEMQLIVMQAGVPFVTVGRN